MGTVLVDEVILLNLDALILETLCSASLEIFSIQQTGQA
jgi:hypothetical protein